VCIAVDLGAYAGEAAVLKSIWSDSSGGGEGRKELLEVLGCCRAMKGLSPLILACLADGCKLVTAKANAVLRLQGDVNCKM
jgi:hypothetical protein